MKPSGFLPLAFYSFYLMATLLVRPVPLRVVYFCGLVVGQIAFFVLSKRRALAISNIQIALGVSSESARELAGRHFRTLGANVLSMLKVPSMNDEALWRHVQINIEHQMSQDPAASGCVAVFGHFSNWELLGRLTRIFPQHRFGVIYRRLANDAVNRHFNKSRAGMGVHLFDRQEEFWMAVGFLESGGILGLLSDQYAGASGTWMPFLGRLTSCSTLAAALAQRVNVPILPIKISTIGFARWQILVGQPIPQGPSIEATTASINHHFENQIRENPADWLWAHNRWKTPSIGFLFAANRQQTFFPDGFDPSSLIPFRILIQSVAEADEAELAAPAVRAIKRGRPEARVAILAPQSLVAFWQSVTDVDEVVGFEEWESAKRIASRIRRAGSFDVGILLAEDSSATRVMRLAGVPVLLGASRQNGLTPWQNAAFVPNLPALGAERYERIANAAGAAMRGHPPKKT